jgi:UDP-N-acetylmuramate dehydrogenase
VTGIGTASPATVARATAELASLGSRVRFDEPVGPSTTYRVGGRAAIVVHAGSLQDLRAVGRAVAASALPVFVLGRGSNSLVADAGFAGIVVRLDGFDRVEQVIDTEATVVAGGAALLPVLARTTVRFGLTGLEWAVGVPGTVGGGVRMNAGGHGSDVAASLVGVHVLDLRTGEDRDVPPSALGLRFRGSDLDDLTVVVSATFALTLGDREQSEQELGEIVRWRREHQPGGQNAGSVFVNPIPGVLSAGQVIDEVGLRGHRLGTATVSDKHANFIQADENGRADDVVALMRLVRERVLAERGIALRSENRLLGYDVNHIGDASANDASANDAPANDAPANDAPANDAPANDTVERHAW